MPSLRARALLMELFTRTEASRNRRTGGAGLGRAIVRGLVKALTGVVVVAEAPIGKPVYV